MGSIFTITATRQNGLDDIEAHEIKVSAKGHRQHIWSETTLIGVSAAGVRRLDAFMSEHGGYRITVDAGPHNPRLIGYER